MTDIDNIIDGLWADRDEEIKAQEYYEVEELECLCDFENTTCPIHYEKQEADLDQYSLPTD